MKLRPVVRSPHEGDHRRDVFAQTRVADVFGQPLVVTCLAVAFVRHRVLDAQFVQNAGRKPLRCHYQNHR